MVRKELPIELPIRLFQRADSEKPFENEILAQLGIDLKYYRGKNVGNRYVLIYSSHIGTEEHVAALIEFSDGGTHFYVTMLVSNRTYLEVPYPGTYLLEQMDGISNHFGYKKIVLDALEKKVPYYENLGYKKTGKTDYHSSLKTLVQMEKLL